MSSQARSNSAGLFDDVTALAKQLAIVNGALLQHKEQLRQRAISLPPTVQTTLLSLEADLKQLADFAAEAQTEMGQLRALAATSAEVTRSLDIDDVLEHAMDSVISLSNAERGYLILIDRETGELEYRIQRDSTSSAGLKKPQVSSGVINEVIRTRQPLLTDNAFNDERLQNNASVANFSLRSVLCVPLSYRDELIGVVYVDNRLLAGIFTERELNLLIAFANTAAVAIENAFLYAELEALLTEITQVQELMNNIFDSIGSGVIATDQAEVITIFNRAAEGILSLPSSESVGQRIADVLPRLPFDLREQLDDVRTNGTSRAFEAEMTVGSTRKALGIQLNPLRDSYDDVQGVAVVLDDLTEQRERENRLRTMKTYLPPQMVDNIATISGLALGGESRDVSCIFVEVRSLYTMKDVHPREVLDILNEYFGIATVCINDTQGVIDKYMGTEMMVLYNTQLNPQQNHCALALEATLMLRDAFVALYAHKGIDPKPHFYRMGLHTGIATLGNVGSLNRRDFTALGDTINLAKRLQENAAFGQIVVSEDVYLCVADHAHGYRFVELPTLQAKGRKQSTRIYEVFRA
jgi:PAS domain S-box-containing protein